MIRLEPIIRSKQMKNPMKSYAKQDPKYASKVWQKAYFNSDRSMSDAQRMAVADKAYQADVRAQAANRK
jgi:hypothetical protein